MRKLFVLILALIIGVASESQPQHYNHLPTAGVNIFPFNVNPASGKKVQWIIAAGELSQPTPALPGNNITTLWFRANAAGNATYTNLTIRMANVSTSTFITIGAFYTGPMTTVRSQNTTIAPTGALTWVSVPLTTPFLYNPAMNLIIEVSQCGFTGTGFSLPQAALGVAPNYRRQYSDAASACGVVALPTGGDLNVPGIGITVAPSTQPCAQNFDAVVAPALPASWTASTPTTCAGSLPWATVNTVSNSAPNSAFTNNPNCISDEVLDSRIFPIVSPTAQLTFRNNYNTESTFDGMVLEIKIGAGAFTDIITAGGSFVAGGYNGTISNLFSSPIAGRQAWTGSSAGFITTTVNLPAAANGQSVVIRWRRATDLSVSATGVWIDDVSVTGSDCPGGCIVTCPANITVSNTAGQCGTIVNYPAPTTNGACGAVTTSPASGSFFPVGTTVVTASTFAGPSCTFTVRVNDVQPPTITCPANMTVNNTTGLCGAIVNFTPTTTDNCPGVTVTSNPASGSTFPVGTTTVNCTATDASGNTASCSFTIRVNDTENPTFSSGGLFPERLYYKFDGTGTTVPNLATAPPAGTATATLTGLTQGGTGKCATALVGTGLANQSLNTNWATDMTAPWTISFWLGPNQVDLNPSYLFGDVNAGAFRCFYGGAALPNNILLRGGTGDVLISGINPAATFITIVYNGVNTVVYKNGGSPQTYAVTFANTGPGPFRVGGYSTLASISGAMDEFGLYTRALTPAEVLSLFNACPVAVNNCPANITVSNTPGTCAAVVNYTTPVGTDNCPGVVTTQTAGLASGSSFPVGTTTNTFRATDAVGNIATCTFTVRVNDTQVPTITCPGNITANTPPNSCTTIVPYTVTSTDNCPGVTQALLSGLASNAVYPLGVTINTWRATDAAGNTSTCSFTVTVVDGQLPVISAQPANRTVCLGTNTSINITVSNAVTYQWQQWNGSAWVNVIGGTAAALPLNNVTLAMNTNTYRVVVTGLCNSVTSNAATLYVNNLPTVSITTTKASLLPGEHTNIVAAVKPTGGSFVWFHNGTAIAGATGSALNNLSIDDQGTYKVTYTDLNGCVMTSNDLVIGGQSSDNLYVMPNPNNGQFQVRFYPISSGAPLTLTVFSSDGSRVYQRQLTSALPYNGIEVDLGVSAGGTYIVEVRDTNGKRIAARRIVVRPN